MCCHTQQNMVFLICAFSEVDFYIGFRNILKVIRLVALLRNSPSLQGLALKPLMYLCLTSQCGMEVGQRVDPECTQEVTELHCG